MNDRPDISIFGKPLKEVEYFVKSKAKFYPDYYQVYVPNIPYKKVESGYEPVDDFVDIRLHKEIRSDKNLEDSIRRTQKTIKDLVQCNQFELFATFTFAYNRDDIINVKSQIHNWLKNQMKRAGKFQYLVVPEFHKDGKALHFHALLKDYKGKLSPAINPKTGKQLKQKGRLTFTLDSYTLGFSNVFKITNTPDDHKKISFYIRKYITKDMVNIFGQHRYYASHGLLKPEEEENPPWFKPHTAKSELIIPNGRIYYFNYDFIPENEKLL